MRPTLACCCLPLCCLLAGACAKDVPPPTEYFKLTYTLTPGGGTGDTPLVIPLSSGTQPCGRDAKKIQVTGYKTGVRATIILNDPYTGPAPEKLANHQTDGYLNIEVIINNGDLGSVGFNSGDPGDLFTCNVCVAGPDPFADFHSTFTCQGKQGPNGTISLSGEAHAVMCPPMVDGPVTTCTLP